MPSRPDPAHRVCGLLLAAGAGRRMGGPKALLRDPAGGWFLDRSLRALRDGGCEPLTLVLGAAADRAGEVLARTGWSADPALLVVVAPRWQDGMGASLRAGLSATATGPAPTAAEAVLVSLVDLPDVGAAVVSRVLAAGSGTAALVRAKYRGRPGHPVLIGRDHWSGVAAAATGDHGARDYLRAHPPAGCECGDLATGLDVDRPEDLDGGPPSGPRPDR